MRRNNSLLRYYHELQRSNKEERRVTNKHHSVSHLIGECRVEKYESSFHEIICFCGGQLRILGLNVVSFKNHNR